MVAQVGKKISFTLSQNCQLESEAFFNLNQGPQGAKQNMNCNKFLVQHSNWRHLLLVDICFFLNTVFAEAHVCVGIEGEGVRPPLARDYAVYTY